jgi:hypothetical protein
MAVCGGCHRPEGARRASETAPLKRDIPRFRGIIQNIGIRPE